MNLYFPNFIFAVLLLVICIYKNVLIITNLLSTNIVQLIQPCKLTVVDS